MPTISHVSDAPSSLEVYLLGLVEFEEMQHLQRRLVYDLGEHGGGALVLCEHPATFSVGRSGSRSHIRPDDEQLREARLPMHWVNRGGGVVLHLPGQLCGYVLLPLSKLDLDVSGLLDGLQRVVLHALSEFDLRGATRIESPGVFLGHARVASIGVAVNRWVSTFGFTLNVGFDLEPMDVLLEEPGIGPYQLHQTTLEARRQRPTPMAKVRECVVRQVEAVFGLAPRHVYTTHPSLRREVRQRVYIPNVG